MNFSIQNDQGEQLGFLLMIADEDIPQTGACLIRFMAQTEALEQNPQAQLLKQLQSLGELIWRFNGQKTILSTMDEQLVAHIKEQILIIQDHSFLLIDLTGNI